MAAAPVPLLSARDLHKAFGARTLLNGGTLNISKGDRVALVGVNGSGKSTLLKMLVGEEPFDGGIVERSRDASMIYLSQEPSFPGDQVVLDAALCGLGAWYDAYRAYSEATARVSAGDYDALDAQQEQAEKLEQHGGWEREHEARALLSRLGVRDCDALMGTLSGGELRRVALARLLVAKPDLGVLDEPTNHLDADTIEWLEEYFSEQYPGALLFVTHDRYFLDALATRVVEIDFAKLHSYEGDYDDFLELKAERYAQEDRAEQNRQNLVRREQAWLRRGAKARSTKQKARIQRAEAVIAERAPERNSNLSVFADASRLGKTILEADNITVGVPRSEADGGPEAPWRVLTNTFELRLCPGDRIGIVGPNGAGKSTLLSALLGDTEPTSGKILRGKNTKFAYFDQKRLGLEDTWSVFDNVAGREDAMNRGGAMVEKGGEKVELRSYLEGFMFDAHKQRQPVGSLSGGERARVSLAKVLAEGANVLVLDEPTNDLDTASLAAVEELLIAWGGCALLVSHDRAFLDRVATGILSFEPVEGQPSNVVLYPGNYDQYLRLRAEVKREAAALAKSIAPPRNSSPPASKAPPATKPAADAPMPKFRVAEAPPKAATGPKLSFKERQELEQLPAKIEAEETRIAELETTLADPAFYAARATELPKMQSTLDAARTGISQMMDRWEKLEARSNAT